jgi:hypothetical protein
MSEASIKAELKSIIEMMEFDFYGISTNLTMAKSEEFERYYTGQKAVLGQYLSLLKDMVRRAEAKL